MTRTYEELIYIINQYVKENNNKEITGDILNNVLNQISLYAKENTDELLRLIDEIETGSYELPEATTSVLGGVKIDGETIVKDLSGRIKAVLDTSNLATKTDLESINTTLTNKVDIVSGKGLSTNDFTTEEKDKLRDLNNYTLPTASTTEKGGVKVDGTTITIKNDIISSVGGGIASIQTSNTGNVKFTGDGTAENPLKAEANVDVNIDSISTTQTAEQLNALADGLYFANGAGVYNISISNPTTGVTVANGKTTVESGYSVSFNKKGNVWSLASSVLIPKDDSILATKTKDFFKTQGGIDVNGNFTTTSSYKRTDFLPVKAGLIIKGSNYSNAPIVYFYDNNYNRISKLDTSLTGNLTITLTSENIPINSFFFVAMSNSSYNAEINMYSDSDLLNYINTLYNSNKKIIDNYSDHFIENNFKSEQSLFGRQGITLNKGSYGVAGSSYTIVNKSKTGALRVAFKFKINEDLNKTSFRKNIISFKKGNDSIDFYAQASPTSIMEGKDNQNASNIISKPPIPLYNSGFGIKSNLSITGDRLNKKMQNRSFYLGGDSTNNQCCYKPLSGDDLFQIRIIALDSQQQPIKNTRSSEAQLELSKWEDAYVEVTDTSINIVNTLISFNKQYLIANYVDFKALYNAIYSELNNLVVGNSKIEIKAISTDFDRYDKTKLLNHKYFIVSKYPASSTSNETNFFVDSFPIYITYGIDTSWHTFEFISFSDRNSGSFTIDGQYIAPYQNLNYTLDGVKPLIIGKDIIIGDELNITISDLQVEFDSINKGEWNTITKNTHFIISDYHPYLLHKFDHEMVISNPVDSFIRKFVSDGGNIPDFYKTPVGYRGDGGVNTDRVQLTNPMYNYERSMSYMRERGYKSPTLKELNQMIHQGVNIGKRLTMFSFDDHNTYMYSNKDIKSVFEKYGYINYHALELGFYVTNDAPTTLYSSSEFITECKDTNNHRELLQKRLLAMQLSNWEIQIHGYKEGYVFQGQTYNEIIDAIQESYNILNYYGISSDTWCFAGNYYTPNAIKILENNGVSIATSTRQEIYGRCHHPCYIPRMGVLNVDYVTRQVF